MRGAVAIGFLCGLGAACIRADAYPCQTDAQCDMVAMGQCVQPPGYCAYPDEMCEGELRFESRAPDELASTCVAEDSGGPMACGGPNEACCENFECSDNGLLCYGDACTCLIDLVVGNAHACGLRIDNRLECWGGNVKHALGRNDEAQSFTEPAPVVNLPQPLVIESIQAQGHTCLVATGGDVWCWGDNGSGQADPESEAGAVAVATKLDLGLDDFDWEAEIIGVGVAHTCVSGESGVFCWGDNEVGQLGWPDDDTPDQIDTSAVKGAIVEIAAGYGHTCVRTAGETTDSPTMQRVYCWGDDSSAQLGNGPGETPSMVPVEVGLDPGLAIASIAAAESHTCAITFEPSTPTQRQVYCWGGDDFGAATGVGGPPLDSPTLVQGLPALEFGDISAGYAHSCVASEDDGVWCWGDNEGGAVTPTVGDQILPPTRVEAEDERGVALYSVGAGEAHNCGLASDGTATCWGCGNVGQLGEDWLFCEDDEGGWGAVRSQCG